MRSFTWVLAGIVLALGVPSVGRAQQGTVTGQIVDGRTQEPLSSVQVYFPTLSLGSLTGANGRFLIANVPAGSHELRAERIGYERAAQTVNVGASGTVAANFALSEEPLALNEIVVTGTAGQARRREVGNSITQLNTTQIVQATPSVESILQGRGLGMAVMQAGAAAGSGAQIRLRGTVSLSLSNQPLIYIDGVRVQNSGYTAGSNVTDRVGPLTDITPEDIERIEIVKGAAATTLYGSEAAPGVIQIFTKRGLASAPRWTIGLDQGFAEVRPFGCCGNDYLFLDPWLKKGHRQRYVASVQGGRTDIQYFVSALWEDNTGPIPNNFQEKLAVRGNFGFNLAERLRLEVNSTFAHDNLEQLGQGGTGDASFILNVIRGEQGYMATRDYDQLSLMLALKSPQTTDRFISGATLTYEPVANFTHRLTVGHDFSEANNRQLNPYNYLDRTTNLGRIRAELWNERNTTVDYVGSYVQPVAGLTSTLSWGAQVNTRENRSVSGDGQDLPGPGDFTVSSATTRRASESLQRTIVGGFFGQVQLAHQDRYFLTVGARFDGNSAFGEELGLEIYPKASMSYIISEEDFWPETLGQMKLRLAYGHAGRAPGAFDAVRTWSTPGWGTLPALAPSNVGNANVSAERTAELEVGFDAAALDNRLAVEFTYYNRQTTDALLPVVEVPSLGNWGSTRRNVGKLENKGIELQVTGRLVERRTWGLTTSLRLSTNYSRMLDMGGSPEYSLPSLGAPLATAWIIEGQPVPVMRAWKLLNPYEKADPVWDQNYIFGPNNPTHIIGGDIEARLPMGIVRAATGEYQGGHYVEALLVGRALTRSVRPWPY
ncbi:MAG: TonB-dependent receptor, partial [Gemmatimonadetes bacterium]|nr:TonB-dependent receptor [Gemmatimonadota bacterium]